MTRPILLLGGGRWARVILGVLMSLPHVKSVIWVSRYGFEANRAWLASQNVTSVTLVREIDAGWDAKPCAVIIATNSALHAHYLAQAIHRTIPVLSEKPFALDVQTAEHLVQAAHACGTVAAVNLEFVYATYLHSFKEYLGARKIDLIEIDWQDPFKEIRHGEVKFGDVYTPLVHDSLPHCWSLLHVLMPEAEMFVSDVTYDSRSQITLHGRCGGAQICIRLNRRGVGRVRKVSVNESQAVLDFSDEPGTVQLRGQEVVQNKWTGMRPLGASLAAFLDAVEDPTRNLPTALEVCLPSVSIAQAAFTRVQTVLSALLHDLERQNRLDATDPYVQNILVDLLLPQMAERPKVHNANDLLQFCESVLHDRRWAEKPA